MSEGGELYQRTKQLALRVIKVVAALPAGAVGWGIGKQLIRSGTSVGANYREACRSRSTAEFVSTLQIALKECAETAYWLELLVESETVPAPRLTPLLAEVNEITAMLVASVNTAKRRPES